MEGAEEGPRKAPRKKGFAAMPAEEVQRIARLGGAAAHAAGQAHKFSKEEATVAGKKGGAAAHAKGTAHRFTSAEARSAGAKGRASRKKKDDHEPCGDP